MFNMPLTSLLRMVLPALHPLFHAWPTDAQQRAGIHLVWDVTLACDDKDLWMDRSIPAEVRRVIEVLIVGKTHAFLAVHERNDSVGWVNVSNHSSWMDSMDQHLTRAYHEMVKQVNQLVTCDQVPARLSQFFWVNSGYAKGPVLCEVELAADAFRNFVEDSTEWKKIVKIDPLRESHMLSLPPLGF